MPRARHYDPSPMSQTDANLVPSAPLPAVAIAVSRYNASITGRLLQAAIDAYTARAGDPASIAVLDAPGAYELPAISLAAAMSGRFAGIAALGCLIRGQTRHDRYIAQAVATGLVNVTIATGIPVTFGVLTVENAKQARARAGGDHGNKGADAMNALLDTIAVTRTLHDPDRSGSISIARIPTSLPDKARPAPVGER
jgi:6,7-dimethyl-8-ribityllumazine synthase